MANTTGFSSYNVLFTDGPYATSQKYTNPERRLNRLLRKGQAGRRLRAILYPLTNSAVGAAALLQAKRVAAVQGLSSETNLGGLVPIELNTLVNRATTAADLAKVLDDMTHPNKPNPYPQAKGNPIGYTAMANKVA